MHLSSVLQMLKKLKSFDINLKFQSTEMLEPYLKQSFLTEYLDFNTFVTAYGDDKVCFNLIENGGEPDFDIFFTI